MKAQKLNRKQARQALYLSRFNFTLKHILETRIGKIDSLSRRPDWQMGVENDNKNQKLIKKEQIRGMIKVVVEGPEMMLLEKIKKQKGKIKKQLEWQKK